MVTAGQRGSGPAGQRPRIGRTRRDRAGEPVVLKGLAASPGRVTAPARLVRCPEDFDALQPGEVLVTAMTTPEHTGLFARAAAVVTDVGGQLDHGAVTALDHALPAVLGTGIATRRLRSGMLVTVDGDRGEVVLPEGEDPIPTGFHPRVPYKFALGAGLAAGAVILRRIL